MDKQVTFSDALLQSKATSTQQIEWLAAAVEYERSLSGIYRDYLHAIADLIEAPTIDSAHQIEALIARHDRLEAALREIRRRALQEPGTPVVVIVNLIDEALDV